jgi:pyridoxal phosphate enzyme (YggS family)
MIATNAITIRRLECRKAFCCRHCFGDAGDVCHPRCRRCLRKRVDMLKNSLASPLGDLNDFWSGGDEMETMDRGSRLEAVRAEIARACRDAGREPASVTLVAVAKTFGADDIEPVIAAGQRGFGENRVQEAKAKWPPLRARHPGLELHLIGSLQSNKAKEAVALFDAIHSVDRASLAEALAKEIGKQGRRPLLFVEVNTGAEPQKAGVEPEEADAFIAACRDRYGLAISGLMCLPPLNDAPAPHFALTAKIARRNGLALLSMGMSSDFGLAIAFGATHVRVGTAIFGERTPLP